MKGACSWLSPLLEHPSCLKRERVEHIFVDGSFATWNPGLAPLDLQHECGQRAEVQAGLIVLQRGERGRGRGLFSLVALVEDEGHDVPQDRKAVADEHV